MTKMHLLWFCAFSPHAGFGLDGWAGPQTGTGYDWTTPELWQDMAVALERAKFDLILLGDSLAVPGTYQGRLDAYLRYAEHAPFHDPSPLVAILAAATRRLGLALTLSTTFYPPFLLARLLTTLDHLSRGRIAWNVVTSYKHEEALNFGYQELLDHDQRYDRADEYLALCAQLWASWAPDAVVMDRGSNTFADPAKVRTIDFAGTWYRSRGPLNATPSPQGRPVILQAGMAGGEGLQTWPRHPCQQWGLKTTGCARVPDGVLTSRTRLGMLCCLHINWLQVFRGADAVLLGSERRPPPQTRAVR
jgi:alkanesulfonate monooxygenase SsuD/methylene tetrahydromethanopterin reductase-like flavin-dependent oxidoreductase (luciferase family)